MNRSTRSRAALAILLLASAAVFAVGVAVERSQPAHHEVAPAAQPTEQTTGGETTSTEGGGGETGTTGENHPAESAGHETSSETVFGINTESTALVILVLAFSVGLAAAVWLMRVRWLLVVVAAFAVSAAVFDVREALHQSDESHALLITIALVVAALHAAAALIAIALARSSETAAA
jgi:hypothetical protein